MAPRRTTMCHRYEDLLMTVVTNILNVNQAYFRMKGIGIEMKQFFVVARPLPTAGTVRV